MLKIISQLKCTIDGKEGQFLCENDTSTVIAKEMCFQFLKYIGQVEDAGRAQQEQQQKLVDANSESSKVESINSDPIEAPNV